VIIFELACEDDGFYVPCGYWTRGHHSKQKFAIECNKDFDLAAQEKPVHTSAVVHGWAIVEPPNAPEKDEPYSFDECSEFRDGAIAVTLLL
jgi:hypothetical protein